jgi:hypothetical protein
MHRGCNAHLRPALQDAAVPADYRLRNNNICLQLVYYGYEYLQRCSFGHDWAGWMPGLRLSCPYSFCTQVDGHQGCLFSLYGQSL